MAKTVNESSDSNEDVDNLETGEDALAENQHNSQNEVKKSWPRRIWDFITDGILDTLIFGAGRILWWGVKAVFGSIWN